jgi:hypothetical protein
MPATASDPIASSACLLKTRANRKIEIVEDAWSQGLLVAVAELRPGSGKFVLEDTGNAEL